MGVSLSKLVEETRTFKAKFNSSHILVTYKPKNLSSKYMSKLQDDVEDDDPEAMAVGFCAIVTEWDLEGPVTDDEDNELVAEGEVIPLEPEIVSWLPTSILGAVLKSIGEDASPKGSKRG